MGSLRQVFVILFIACLSTVSLGQGVGVVLSGGGASGFAHIGVLKALEENNIPIDYITGTSAGALVGGMYAAGYSPAEIEAYVLGEKFQLMVQGKLEQGQEFLLREDEPNASLLSFSFSKDSIIKKALPTNFIRPELLDFEMLRLLGMPGAAYGNDFNRLFVPFRCVASDIVAKKGVVFRKGHLNEAIRASMTYPFFMNPIRINGILYFDGGLYNNFPADVLYEEFNPDFIIGSNVSYNAAPPQEDDLISQLTNMLVSYSNFTLPCNEGILITPNTGVGSFEFSSVEQAIQQGYFATLLQIDSIRMKITEVRLMNDVQAKRLEFRGKIPKLSINEVVTTSEKGLTANYVQRALINAKKGKPISAQTFERRYFRTYATPEVQFLYPTLDLTKDSNYRLKVNVRKAKDFRVDVGGIFSSRSINTGFVQLNYLRLGKVASDAQFNSYFGKFYGSVRGALDFHLPTHLPLSFSVYIVRNRLDYFRSSSTFFEEVKPSFLVQEENYVGAQFKIPILNNSKSTFDYRYIDLLDRYYQTNEFTNKDTADVTKFYGSTVQWTVEQNSLNRKQFASEGNLLSISARYVVGHEHSISGTKSSETFDFKKNHNWFNINGEFKSFPFPFRYVKVGLHAKASLTSQSLFQNYTASVLNLNAFNPLPDMLTYFQPEYRSPQYVGGGINLIISPIKDVDIRFDAYLFQPFKQLTINDDGSFGYSKLFKGETQVVSLSGIYHSPIGPVRLSLNYFQKQATPVVLQVSYGYIIFNERAAR